MKTETLYHLIECRDTEETEVANTEPKKPMLQLIGEWYKDGFRFLESFELAKRHYGVFTKEAEVAVSTAPMETANERDESLDALRTRMVVWGDGNEPMISEADAKTLANVAYNRAKHLPCEDCTQQDFERWWTEFRKENGFAEQPSNMVSKLDAKLWAYTMYMRAKMRTEREGDACTNDFEWAWNEFCDRKEGQPSGINRTFEKVYAHLNDLAKICMHWSNLEMRVKDDDDSGYAKFWETIKATYDEGIPSDDFSGLIDKQISQGMTRADYLKLIADEIVANQSKEKEEPKDLLERLTDVACDYFGWKGNLDEPMRVSDNALAGFLDTVTRKLNMFGGNMATINYYVDNGYSRIRFLQEIAEELHEGKEPTPKADAITPDEVLPRIKALAIQFFGWQDGLFGSSVSLDDKDCQLFHTVIADEYELELDVEATNAGMDLFNITQMQYLEKVAESVADALNKPTEEETK